MVPPIVFFFKSFKNALIRENNYEKVKLRIHNISVLDNLI